MFDKDLNKVIVKYCNNIVGYIVLFDDKTVGFQYDEEWLKHGFSISPLSLPLSNKIYRCGKSFFNGLYGVFYDSLADGWGELVTRRTLSKSGINYDRLNPLEKLSIINKNGLGGLEYEPSFSLNIDNCLYSLDDLVKDAYEIINNNVNNANLDLLYKLGGSTGGARPKVYLNINNENWIVKFPCGRDNKDVGKKEYEANLLAKECGININECNLFPSNICNGYFGAKRFDRNDNERVHMISLCALLETSHRLFNLDYNHLFGVIEAISINKLNDLYEAFRRMCFNVFYDNKDDHGKNFSFIYSKEMKGYILSPAYDLNKTNELYEHAMTINGEGNPNENDLLEVGKNHHLSLKKCKEIINHIKNLIFNKK